MNTEQKQRLGQIEKWADSFRTFYCTPENAKVFEQQLEDAHRMVKFLLSIVKEQEASGLTQEILKTLDDAIIRVGCSANCYDVPADANSGAEYVAMRVRQVIAPDREAKPAAAPSGKVERFYFLDSHGDTAFVREADYEHAVTSTRSRCVEKVKSLAESWAKSVDEQWDDRPDLSFDAAERLKAAGEIIKELESVSLQEQKS